MNTPGQPLMGPLAGGLAVRELAERDLDAVADLEARINPQPWSRNMLAEELSLPPGSRHWLVAVEAGSPQRLVGFGGMMYAPDATHLMLVGVDPGYTRRGIAARLCATLYLEARSRGAEGITLEVRQSNRAAVALYTKLGMTSVGRRPGYYPDGEDAEIYWLHELQTDETAEMLTRLAGPSLDRSNPNPRVEDHDDPVGH